MQSTDRLEFRDYFALHQDIDALAFDNFSLVNYVDVDLPCKIQSAQLKFVAQGFFVDGFEQTWSKHSMDFDRRTDNRMR